MNIEYEHNYKCENIKLILIICVVLGHLLESIPGGGHIYQIIYSFHMPMFIFLNGWFASKEVSKKSVWKLIYPYIIFQILYAVFNTYIINDGNADLYIQFTTPYWLLWYLLTLLYYYLLMPIVSTDNYVYAIGVVIGSILLSIFVGFDTSVGYYMSLSRTFVFLPFFVCGYYVGHNIIRINGISVRRPAKIIFLLLLVGICRIVYKQGFALGALFGSLSYKQGEYSFLIRLELMMIAFVWIAIFMTLIPDQKIFGRIDTFSVFVLHGFIVLFIRKYNLFTYSLIFNLFLAFLISVGTTLSLGNKYVSGIVKFVFRGEWMEKVWSKLTIK